MYDDDKYLEIMLLPIRACSRYKPKFGQGAKSGGLTLTQFQDLYQSDPFYKWFGLDNPLIYAAHKAAGGMTSVYRQIGIGCENLFRTILMDSLGLTPADVTWCYEVPLSENRTRVLRLDGRVPLNQISDKTKRRRFHNWMKAYGEIIGIEKSVFATLTGTVFEVRQGYKSKDSKRQNADIANAATAYTKSYLPCAVILSTQIDGDVLLRYRSEKWAVITGIEGKHNPLISTYDFMREIVGYDLAAFFNRNSKILRIEIDKIVNTLLAPETTL